MISNSAAVHPFHQIARPGEKIHWGSIGDEYSSVLEVGHDGQLTWANGIDPEAAKARYVRHGRELVGALYAGQLTVAEYAEERFELVGDYQEAQTWDWGDAVPALDVYAKDMM
jgi:hypothetical protein